MHLCLSGNPYCSGINPCPKCFATVRIRILSRAMATVGGPFTDPDWAPLLPQAVLDCWRAELVALGPQLQQTLTTPPQPEAAGEDLASAANQTEEQTEQTPEHVATPDPATEDPEQLGYPIPPENMAAHLAQIRKGVLEQSEQTPVLEGAKPNANGLVYFEENGQKKVRFPDGTVSTVVAPENPAVAPGEVVATAPSPGKEEEATKTTGAEQPQP